MIFSLTDQGKQIDAPAKINLNLKLTGKREDGLHLLDSAVVFTKFGDRLTISPSSSDQDEISVTGPFAATLDGGSDQNICLAAVQRFRAAGIQVEPLAIHIDKQIPVGAGMGGGSSDAGALLRFLNTQSKTPLDRSGLAELALSLGADVPACTEATPQRMQGIGEKLAPLNADVEGPILLANPNRFLATKDVFAACEVTPEKAASDQTPQNISPPQNISLSGPQLVSRGNDLQKAALSIIPEMADLLERLSGADGALAAQMTGSGASCFALFQDRDACDKAAKMLQMAGFWAVSTEILPG